MKVLVTGAAGFIGYHLARRLLAEGHRVVGIDNLNPYYDVRLKLDRLAQLQIDPIDIAMGKQNIQAAALDFSFRKLDISEASALNALFATEGFDAVVHLAAQAGVRYSLEQPHTYVNSNLVGFANILESCRHHSPHHLVFASSSSVYGQEKAMPFRTDQPTDAPISLYAASKKSNELMAHAYSHLFGIPTTGLRFFTVYGEWGRPDMAAMLFAKAIAEERPIRLFNNGHMSRDFTYVGDIVEGIYRVLMRRATAQDAPTYRLYNIGKGAPVNLLEFVRTMEAVFGKKALVHYEAMQPGDVQNTFADVSGLERDFGYQPRTGLREGLTRFVDWYRQYYHLLPSFHKPSIG